MEAMNIEAWIGLGTFAAIQIGGALIFAARLKSGQEIISSELDKIKTEVKENVTRLSTTLSGLVDAISAIRVSDARGDERIAFLTQQLTGMANRIDSMEEEVQRMRSKWHQVSGFLLRTSPEWKDERRGEGD